MAGCITVHVLHDKSFMEAWLDYHYLAHLVDVRKDIITSYWEGGGDWVSCSRVLING
jgi:hypothetical protein